MLLINLLEETLHILQEHGQTPERVAWVGARSGQPAVSWQMFAEFADSIDYDIGNAGYGEEAIPEELVVVGKDGTWWLERDGCDNAGWWEYKTAPQVQGDIMSDWRAHVHLGQIRMTIPAGWENEEDILTWDQHLLKQREEHYE